MLLLERGRTLFFCSKINWSIKSSCGQSLSFSVNLENQKREIERRLKKVKVNESDHLVKHFPKRTIKQFTNQIDSDLKEWPNSLMEIRFIVSDEPGNETERDKMRENEIK